MHVQQQREATEPGGAGPNLIRTAALSASWSRERKSCTNALNTPLLIIASLKPESVVMVVVLFFLWPLLFVLPSSEVNLLGAFLLMRCRI